MKKYLAGFLVLAAVIIVLVGDLVIVMKWGYAYSISEFMNWLSREFPVAILLIGIVLGHFIWPIKIDSTKP